jgi:adenosylmethionine-8-amino-7-oxononanoate aminotransferase
MAPALLLDDSSSPCAASDTCASPSIGNQAAIAATSLDRQNRRSPLLKRSIRNPSLWLKSAKGSWLSVTDGTKTWKIFDASGGAGVSSIGHGDRRVHEAIKKQEETGIAYAASVSFDTEVVCEFADYLVESTRDEMVEVAFYSSGSVTRTKIGTKKLTRDRL